MLFIHSWARRTDSAKQNLLVALDQTVHALQNLNSAVSKEQVVWSLIWMADWRDGGETKADEKLVAFV